MTNESIWEHLAFESVSVALSFGTDPMERVQGTEKQHQKNEDHVSNQIGLLSTAWKPIAQRRSRVQIAILPARSRSSAVLGPATPYECIFLWKRLPFKQPTGWLLHLRAIKKGTTCDSPTKWRNASRGRLDVRACGRPLSGSWAADPSQPNGRLGGSGRGWGQEHPLGRAFGGLGWEKVVLETPNPSQSHPTGRE